MQPLSLTLKGFRGIRDGMGQDILSLDFERLADGADLIAIVGANGRGKTTVMDNMHPYLTMPSRAALGGPGGFSYYDHVCLPENEKDLTWAHAGRSYRSQVVIRLNGRRRTEAYLHVLDDDGRWSPVRLEDGLVSDGKVETYNRCVEAVCGSPDTFFTSVFSAQGKRQLSHYRNAEIKALLSDLLGQDEIRALGQLALLSVKTSQIAQARVSLVDIERELATLGPEPADMQGAETSEEQSERQQILAFQQGIAQQSAQQAQHYRCALDRLDGVLAKLPASFDERALENAAQVLDLATLAAASAEQAHLAAVRDAQTLAALSEQALALAVRRVRVEARVSRAEESLGAWHLFARCMSNDGLIALAIDDAGPALSGLANDLLLACYGPRFTVSLLTLVETAKGEQREGFDIIVHDADSGESKSVALMSGGERVWVNECLTRAVALYLAQHSGRSYDTLFSDEADGALDPERKRMFMAMKREVLRLGGYQREFYVSQTPELTAMADAVIDLDALRLTLQKERAPA